MPKQESKTAAECLYRALEDSPRMGKVLVLWESQEGTVTGSSDNGLTLAETLYMIEMFKAWLLRAAAGGK
jgi:hypothetical protein